MAESGVAADRAWTPAFRGQRPPFGPANDRAATHGAYALLRLAPRAAEIAAELRELVPLASPADSATIDALAMVLSQLERAALVLGRRQANEFDALREGRQLTRDDRDDLRRLAADARGWANTARRYLETLGLTPSARASLGLDVALTRRARSRSLNCTPPLRSRPRRSRSPSRRMRHECGADAARSLLRRPGRVLP